MIKVIIWLCHSKLPMILETQRRIRLFDGAFSGWLISLSLISHNNSKLPLQSRPNGRSTGWKLYRMLVTSGSMIKDWCLSTVKRCLMLLLFAFKQPARCKSYCCFRYIDQFPIDLCVLQQISGWCINQVATIISPSLEWKRRTRLVCGEKLKRLVFQLIGIMLNC